MLFTLFRTVAGYFRKNRRYFGLFFLTLAMYLGNDYHFYLRSTDNNLAFNEIYDSDFTVCHINGDPTTLS